MDCSPSGFSVHRVFRARILEWAVRSSYKGSCWPRDGTCVSCVSYIGRQFLPCWVIQEVLDVTNVIQWPPTATPPQLLFSLPNPRPGRRLNSEVCWYTTEGGWFLQSTPLRSFFSSSQYTQDMVFGLTQTEISLQGQGWGVIHSRDSAHMSFQEGCSVLQKLLKPLGSCWLQVLLISLLFIPEEFLAAR